MKASYPRSLPLPPVPSKDLLNIYILNKSIDQALGSDTKIARTCIPRTINLGMELYIYTSESLTKTKETHDGSREAEVINSTWRGEGSHPRRRDI